MRSGDSAAIQHCPDCGSPAMSGERFCSYCGTHLSEPRSVTSGTRVFRAVSASVAGALVSAAWVALSNDSSLFMRAALTASCLVALAVWVWGLRQVFTGFPEDTTLTRLLRVLLVVDSSVLLYLGGLLTFAPAEIAEFMGFQAMPPTWAYLLAYFGCAMAAFGLGYALAASDPARQATWVQIGIARGVLSFVLGIAFWLAGEVRAWQIIPVVLGGAGLAGFYLLLYPRKWPKTQRAD
ncbi:MAG: zinc ribbon domain-containing protein [Verrucomicrobiae bacterium]|nr:zinc ribbon domain-containing protein [Verrucomicrobiae bacterium]